MTTVYDHEREIPAAEAEAFKDQIYQMIIQYHTVPTFMLTFRKDGLPRMRPVDAFLEGWTINTITQDKHVKTAHIRRNPVVGYLWVDRVGRRPGMEWAPKSVYVQGRAELIDDPDEVAAFFERRRKGIGVADAHPHDLTYRRILVKVTPEYLRAEGFAEASRPVILRDFS